MTDWKTFFANIPQENSDPYNHKLQKKVEPVGVDSNQAVLSADNRTSEQRRKDRKSYEKYLANKQLAEIQGRTARDAASTLSYGANYNTYNMSPEMAFKQASSMSNFWNTAFLPGPLLTKPIPTLVGIGTGMLGATGATALNEKLDRPISPAAASLLGGVIGGWGGSRTYAGIQNGINRYKAYNSAYNNLQNVYKNLQQKIYDFHTSKIKSNPDSYNSGADLLDEKLFAQIASDNPLFDEYVQSGNPQTLLGKNIFSTKLESPTLRLRPHIAINFGGKTIRFNKLNPLRAFFNILSPKKAGAKDYNQLLKGILGHEIEHTPQQYYTYHLGKPSRNYWGPSDIFQDMMFGQPTKEGYTSWFQSPREFDSEIFRWRVQNDNFTPYDKMNSIDKSNLVNFLQDRFYENGMIKHTNRYMLENIRAFLNSDITKNPLLKWRWRIRETDLYTPRIPEKYQGQLPAQTILDVVNKHAGLW